MDLSRRFGLAAVASSILGVLAAGGAAAATGPVPIDETPIDPGDPLWPLPFAVGLAVIAVGLVAAIQPRARRPIGAVAALVATGLATLILVGAGLFSDFSGNHNIQWPLVVAGAAVLVGGLLAVTRIIRGGYTPRRGRDA
jgi:hypothetical protein